MKCQVRNFLVILVLSHFFAGGIAIASSGESSALFKSRILLEKNNLEDVVKEYRTAVENITMDNLKLKGDREWLLLKIMRIKSQKRKVSELLTGAKARIDSKIKAQNEEKKHLLGKLESHYRELGGLDRQVRKKYGKKKPDWWIIDPVVEPKVRAIIARAPQKKVTKKSKPRVSKKKSDIQKKIKSMGLGDWVELINSNKGPRLENRLPILFASGKTTVSKEYGSFFKKLAKLIKLYPSRVVVEGFTDRSRVTSKKYDSNFELGARRAANVVNELIRYGVNPAVFSVESRGEFGQNVPGSSKRNRALSRRAEIIVFFKP